MREKIKLPIVLCLTLAMVLGLSSMAYAGNTPSVPDLVRYGGKNRYETANAIADAIDSAYDCDTVVIATASGFADALAASPLAAALEAPILLSESRGLNDETMAQISKTAPSQAIIIGGTGVVPSTVETQLSSLGISSERLSGSNRYGTALAIANYMFDMNDQNPFASVFLVSANNFPDALSVSPVAGALNVPILYAPASGTLDSDTYNFINYTVNGSPYIIGGPTLISETVASSAESATGNIHERIYGMNRYETSAKINLRFGFLFDQDSMCIASGQNYPDALSGSVFAALNGYSLLLVQNNKTYDCLHYIIRNNVTKAMYIFGGTGVVNDETALSLTGIPSQIPNIEQTHALELRYLGQVANPYTAQNGSSYYMAEVQNVSYSTAPGSYEDHYNVAVTVTWKGIDTNIPGSIGMYMKSYIYDQGNGGVAYNISSDTVIVSSDSTFSTTTVYSNVPWGTFELYIDNIYLGAQG